MLGRGFFLVRFGAAICASLASVSALRADSDTLKPLTFQSFPADLKRALSRSSIRDGLTVANCLEGGSEKRKVCTYKLGGYMTIMVSTEKGSPDLAALTMICGPSNDLDNAKCLLAYGAAIMMTAPALDTAARGKIMNTLISGLEVGSQISITTDERRFILQKSMGIWFHVYASDVAD
jgi:hypothetical protein